MTLAGLPENAGQRQLRLPLEQGGQIRTLHVLHRQVERAVDLAQVVDADDVGMGDLARELQLALEPVFELAKFRLLGARVDANQLQRDRRAEGLIPGLINGRHAAGAEHADDGVAAAEMMARLEEVHASRHTPHPRRISAVAAG
jgi:hypothetical protein